MEVKQVMAAVLQEKSGGFDIPLVQATVGIPLCAHAKCTRGCVCREKAVRAKKLHRRAFTEGMK